MKQKLLYIIMFIAAILAGSGEAWGQEGVSYITITDVNTTRPSILWYADSNVASLVL